MASRLDLNHRSQTSREHTNTTDRNPGLSRPHWLLAELTYACPLQCPYCSNPVDFARYGHELSTEDWLRVMRQARAMGAVQLGFSGGEPLVRKDLEMLIAEGRSLGFYTNLITSGVGLTERRLQAFKEAGLDHIQLSIQAPEQVLNDYIAGVECFEKKLEAARLIKKYGYPMVLCFVRHRMTEDHVEETLELAIQLGADYVELAATQYTGWDYVNRGHLLPTREQVERSEAVAHRYQEQLKGKMTIYYVVQDHHDERPKACMNGWGAIFLMITPDGTALPCHSARMLPGIEFPNVGEYSLEWIWNQSPAFNRYRGDEWMKEPCRSCPDRTTDFAGCRCQAYLLTGDAANADPVCSLSPHHNVVLDAVAELRKAAEKGHPPARPLLFRNPRTSMACSITASK